MPPARAMRTSPGQCITTALALSRSQARINTRKPGHRSESGDLFIDIDDDDVQQHFGDTMTDAAHFSRLSP